MRTRLLSLAAVWIAILCMALPAFAQGERGAITGLITDAVGAVVPNVNVTATQSQTGTTFKAVSTSVGVYRIPYLPSGNYRVTAELKGFKIAIVEPVVVAVAAVVTADLSLQVGSNTESVTVSAEATRLESSSSELGYTINSEDFHTWTISSNDDGQRQIQSFIFSALPGTSGDSYQGSINGSPQGTQEIYIEGISIGRADIAGDTAEFTPSVDAISESRLQTGGLSAAYGGGLTAVENFSIKSGTNQLHGAAYEYVMNNVLNANGFDNNAFGNKKAPFKQNSYGATVGGPVWVPKLYNGKNRSFWFFSWEADRKREGYVSGFRTLPTSQMKQGNFSGEPAIFDPHSTVQLASGAYQRTPFTGNTIPTSQISKVSAAILKVAPIPDPTLSGILRNMPGIINQPIFNLDTFAGKFDQTINDKQKLTLYINHNERLRFNGAGRGYLPVPGSASGSFASQDINGTMVRVGYDWTIAPTLLNHLGIGVNRLSNDNSSLSQNGDWPTKIGLSGVAQTTFPQIGWSGTTAQGGALTILGRSNVGNEPNGSYIVANDTTWIHAGHSIRWGVEVRKYFYNQDFRSSTSGQFTFGPAQTADPQNAGTTGFSFASFMLGAVTKSHLAVTKVNNPQSRIWNPAFYVADDWKATRHLTINIGLRWDIVGGVYEVNNINSGLDPTMPNPGAANYPGALVFLSDLHRKSFQDTFYGELGPRLGFAYALSNRLVVRGGYGLMYTPPIANQWGLAVIDGYSGSNDFATSNRDPNFYWDSGYPAYTHTLPNKDPSLDNGSGIVYNARDSARQPYTQNYTLGIQFLLNGETTIAANYVGNKGSRLNAGNFANMNQLNPKYLSLGDKLLDDASAHPEIKLPYAGFDGTVAQALLPYPQYSGGGVAFQFPHFGRSSYNALQVVTSRRLSKGLGFLISYAFQKSLTNTDSANIYYGGTSQDVYNRSLEKSVASFDRTQQLRLTWIVEVPFGKGRHFMNHGGVMNQVLGGWTLTANQQYQSGNPLSIGTSLDASGYLFNGGIRADVLSGTPLKVSPSGHLDVASGTGLPYLNPAAFAEPPSTANGVVARLGNAPRYFGNLRGPMLPTEDFGLFKRFPFGEARRIEFRADMFNVFNRSRLGDPVTTVGDPQFGQIIDVQQGPRQIQLSLRVTF